MRLLKMAVLTWLSTFMLAGAVVPQAIAETIKITMNAVESDVVIDNKGSRYPAWSYDGLIPGRVVRIKLGDTLDFTLNNAKGNKKSHSIDFHAAQVDLLNEFGSVRPGHSKHFRFTPRYAGVFMYHCGSNPLVQHIARGMYGVIIVDPKSYSRAYPKPDREYVLVQSQYFPDAENVAAMVDNSGWTNSLINGKIFHYDPIHDGNATRVLMAKPGERVRVFFVNANVNMPVSFHAAAGIWDRVYIDGNPKNVLVGVQSYGVPVGGASTFDIVSPADRDTTNALMDHTMGAAQRGAVSLLMNTPGADPKLGKGENILIR
ncbi:MAG: multicopper oxidase domain-containing protein [Mariprofundus sp.]